MEAATNAAVSDRLVEERRLQFEDELSVGQESTTLVTAVPDIVEQGITWLHYLVTKQICLWKRGQARENSSCLNKRGFIQLTEDDHKL